LKGSVSTWSYSDQGKENHEAIFGKDKPKTGGKRRYVVRDGEVVEDKGDADIYNCTLAVLNDTGVEGLMNVLQQWARVEIDRVSGNG